MIEPQAGEPTDGPLGSGEAYGGLSPGLFERLRGELSESVAVVDAEGRVRSLLGPPSGAVGIGQVVGRHIFEYCAPDDLPRALELAVEALGSSPGWETTWNVPLRCGDGTVRAFEIRVANHQDDPEIDGFILRLRELPRRAEATNPLFASELGRELESLAGAMPLPILLIGSDGRLYYANDAAREMCAAQLDEVFASGIGALADGEERRQIEEAVEALRHQPGERSLIFRQRATGELRVVEAQISGLGKGERVLALVVTLVDITARHLTESELRRRAISDPLTGLLNRSEIEESLCRRLATPGRPVGVCYIDLDGFKLVNDTHGHEVGDEFLVAIADAISGELSPADEVGRFGGDEFVIAAEVEEAGALEALAGRVAAAVARRASALGFAVTASIGTSVHLPGDTPRDLIRRADRAMYEEKRLRRIAADAL